MKKLFILVVLTGLAIGCSSSQSKSDNQVTTRTKNTSFDTTYQIVDQEFENYVVANDNYDRVLPYEEQINASSYIQSTSGRSKTTKPNKVQKEKTVVDGHGNILSPNAKASVTDQETLPSGSGR